MLTSKGTLRRLAFIKVRAPSMFSYCVDGRRILYSELSEERIHFCHIVSLGNFVRGHAVRNS